MNSIKQFIISYWFEGIFFILGLCMQLYTLQECSLSTAFFAIGLLLQILPFFVIDRTKASKLQESFIVQQKDIIKRLSKIDEILGISEPLKLRVAIFDHLLIYLPMYVAAQAGYLKQEGIAVDFLPKGGDEEVARAVNLDDADVGLCDPCMCAQEQFRKRNDGKLMVLAPLVTKNAVAAVTKHMLRIKSRLKIGGEISIATFHTPSTTFVIASSLKNRLERESKSKSLSVNLVELPPDEFAQANLYNLLESYELVMLWDPLLAFVKQQAEVMEYEVMEYDLELSENVMYSSLIVSQRLLDNEPTLGIRIFRALSRATHRMYLAVHNVPIRADIISATKQYLGLGQMSDPDIWKLIQEMIETREIFLLLTEPTGPNYPSNWLSMFLSAIEDRRSAIMENLVDIKTTTDCSPLFCPLTAFGHVSSP